MIFKTAAIMAAAIGALGLAAPASANESRYEATLQRVAYGDLNVLTPAGMKELQRRVDRAAFRACRFADDGATHDSQSRGLCLRQTREKVVFNIAQAAAKRPTLGG